MPPFRILRIAKRGLRQPLFPQYRSIHQEYDSEKSTEHSLDIDDEEAAWRSEPSSRSSSRSYTSKEGMLNPRSKSAAHAYDADRIPRRRCHVFFSLALGSLLVGLALWLLLMGQRSAREAEAVALSKPDRLAIWEQFPKIERYFGGVRSLVLKESNQPEYPGLADELLEELRSGLHEQREPQEHFTELSSPSMGSHAIGNFTVCALDAQSEMSVPTLQGYRGIPTGFPDPIIGSYEELELDSGTCSDRFGRLGPYGLGYSAKFGGTGAGMEGDREGSDDVWKEFPAVDYRKVQWATAQAACIDQNKIESTPKTAILLRTWSNYAYDAEDVIFLRALITELALTSGGKYSVHFLIQVEDDTDVNGIDDATRDEILDRSLPAEFQGMAILWSERQMSILYDSLEESGRDDKSIYSDQRSTFMAVQRFADAHPEYDFIWNWEMDVRYTGHMRHLLDQVGLWSRKQPRKGLWERSARFYIPSDHGSWEEFVQMVRVQSEHGTGGSQPNPFEKYGIDSKNPLAHLSRQKPVWGALPPHDSQRMSDSDIIPPTSYHADTYAWGVGEEADLVTFNPIFNPEGTSWRNADDVTGYNTTFDMLPRRASIGTTVRLSKRLLQRMQSETADKGHHMASEMWPASVALHHGLKAVYAPHPVFVDRKWPVDYLTAVFNGGRNGAAGGARLSVFSDDRDDVFRGTTWYEDAGFAAKLWKRWLGYRVDSDGGEQWELANEGRMCLPPMLLHPVKQIDLVYTTDE